MATRADGYTSRDGAYFPTLEEAQAHEATLEGAALHKDIDDLIEDSYTAYEFHSKEFIDKLLSRYDVVKKPVPHTGELRTR